MDSIKSDIEKYNVILSVLPTYFYSEGINHILKNLSDKRICYVNLNKTTESLMKSIEDTAIDTKNMFFIDAVTSSVNPDADYDNAILVSSPYALTELGIAISEVLKTNKFDILVFDSLSTLNLYSTELKNSSGKFTSHIINRIRMSKNKGVLTCLKNDVATDLIRQSSMFVDKVIVLDKFEEKSKDIAGKTAAIVASILGLGAIAYFYNSQDNVTAMAVSNTGSYSGLIPAVVITLIIIGAVSLIINTRKKPAILQVKSSPRKVNPDKIRKMFRTKINGWLKSLKSLHLF